MRARGAILNKLVETEGFETFCDTPLSLAPSGSASMAPKRRSVRRWSRSSSGGAISALRRSCLACRIAVASTCSRR